jgi:hypothetical protein
MCYRYASRTEAPSSRSQLAQDFLSTRPQHAQIPHAFPTPHFSASQPASSNLAFTATCSSLHSGIAHSTSSLALPRDKAQNKRRHPYYSQGPIRPSVPLRGPILPPSPISCLPVFSRGSGWRRRCTDNSQLWGTGLGSECWDGKRRTLGRRG